MTTIWIVLGLLIVGEGALLFAMESAPRALEQRFSDLAVKVRVGRGKLDDEEDDYQGTAGMLLRWATRRLPAPKADTAKAEKLLQTLARAGFNGPGAARIFAAV